MADYTIEVIPTSDFIEEMTLDEPVIDVISRADFAPEITLDEPVVDVISVNDFMDEMTLPRGGGATQSVVNRVWDTVAGDYVQWITEEMDLGGEFYPGPGAYGIDTEDYVVENLQYSQA